MIIFPSQRFELGEVVMTPGVVEKVLGAGVNFLYYARRHAIGDWGDLGTEDKEANDRAVENGERILSSYKLPNGVKLWIITEADRAVTTLLLPEEY